jgi:hypothetical protein
VHRTLMGEKRIVTRLVRASGDDQPAGPGAAGATLTRASTAMTP